MVRWIFNIESLKKRFKTNKRYDISELKQFTITVSVFFLFPLHALPISTLSFIYSRKFSGL